MLFGLYNVDFEFFGSGQCVLLWRSDMGLSFVLVDFVVFLGMSDIRDCIKGQMVWS